MNKEDYFKYYIQGSDHYLIPKDIFNELFDEMSNWKEEVKELNKQLEQKVKCIQEERDYLFNKLSIENKWLSKENQQLKHILDEKEKLIDTILTFNLFGEECPLNFDFEKDSLQEKAQSIFYEDDGEYCENNCNECYKKCWLRFFNKIKELRGREDVK